MDIWLSQDTLQYLRIMTRLVYVDAGPELGAGCGTGYVSLPVPWSDLRRESRCQAPAVGDQHQNVPEAMIRPLC